MRGEERESVCVREREGERESESERETGRDRDRETERRRQRWRDRNRDRNTERNRGKTKSLGGFNGRYFERLTGTASEALDSKLNSAEPD